MHAKHPSAVMGRKSLRGREKLDSGEDTSSGQNAANDATQGSSKKARLRATTDEHASPIGSVSRKWNSRPSVELDHEDPQVKQPAGEELEKLDSGEDTSSGQNAANDATQGSSKKARLLATTDEQTPPIGSVSRKWNSRPSVELDHEDPQVKQPAGEELEVRKVKLEARKVEVEQQVLDVQMLELEARKKKLAIELRELAVKEADLTIKEAELKKMYDVAAKKHETLVTTFSKLSWRYLCDCGQFHKLPVATYRRGSSFPEDTYRFMGRKFVQELREFILDLDRGSIGYVLGTPGYGNTWAVATIAGKLVQEYYHVEELARPERKHFVYIMGEAFVTVPFDALLTSTIIAYMGDGQAINELRQVQTITCLVSWLKAREEQLFFLVDEANGLDDERKSTHIDPKDRAFARKLINDVGQAHRILKCSSINSGDIWHLTRNHNTQKYKVFGGGYSDEEFAAYKKHLKERKNKDLSELQILAETGYVPRFLYLWEKNALQANLYKSMSAIRRYVQNCAVNDLFEIQKYLAGDRVISELTACMAAGSFYRDGTGAVQCLSESLRSFATAVVLERLKKEVDGHIKVKLLPTWLEPVKHFKDNQAMVGWNAEKAVLVVLAFEGVVIKGLKAPRKYLRCVPEVVKSFTGTFFEALAHRVKSPTLHIPQAYYHPGVDAVYQDLEVVVMFQVSVLKNIVAKHPKSVTNFLDMVKSDNRQKFFVWIGRALTKNILDMVEHTEITLSFSDVDGALSSLDGKDDDTEAAEDEHQVGTCQTSDGCGNLCGRPVIKGSTLCGRHGQRELMREASD